LALSHTSLFKLSVVGDPRSLEPVVFKESYRIAREALINAFQHSQAKGIEAEITYGDSGVCIRVRDDGMGVDEGILSKGRAGHWGLSGMRERANKMGAQVNIWSSSGAGTEVELTIPAKVAYPAHKAPTLWQRVKGAVTRTEEARP
jgi:signal transduction histidine kinase